MSPYRPLPVAPSGPRGKTPWVVLVVCTAFYLLDVAVMGLGVFAVIAMITAGVYVLVAGVALVRSYRSTARRRLGRALWFVATAAAIVGSSVLDAHGLDDRAHAVISALQRYRATHGRCPDRLEDLVPAQLSRVPRARWARMVGRFHYGTWLDQHTLRWTAFPTFERRFYECETGGSGIDGI